MSRRAKGKRRQPDRDGWNPTGQRIVATDLDDFDDLDDPGGLPPFLLAMAREDLGEAVARAAWGSRPASPPTQGNSPKAAAQQEPPPRSSPPIARNTPPASPWEALRRLLACNRQQLAARLGISRHTLQRWERGELTEAGAARVAALMQETLAAAGAGWTVTPVFSQAAPERGKPQQPPG